MAETLILAAKEEHRYYPYQGIFFVTRRSFWLAGQDSFSDPPTQNPDMFESLNNVEPVTTGVLKRRRGYQLFSAQSPAIPYVLGYSFRNDLLGLRDVVFTSASNVLATDESGNVIANPLFVPSTGALTPRMVLSRNFGYFTDGLPADNQKWDGVGLSKWGIDINSAQAQVGPNSPTVGISGGGSGGPFKPTNFSNDSFSSGNPFANPNLAFDSSTATFSSGVDSSGFASPSGCTWFGFPAGPASPSSVTLTVIAGFTKTGTGLVNGKILYSLNNGSTFSTLATTTTTQAVTSYSVALPLSQDLTQVQVQAQAVWASGSGDSIETDVYDISISTSVGSLWTLPGNIFSLNGLVATASTPPATNASSGFLQAQGFNFAGLSSATISGVLVEAYISHIDYTGNENARVTLSTQLLKSGTPTGNILSSITLSPGAINAYIPMGGANNLWGASWLGSDIQSPTFGSQLFFSSQQIASAGHTTQGTVTVNIDHIRITVFTQASPLIATPGGAGNITLLSGRVYFYAFQNSRTGHTSDLSPASLTTGPLTSQVVNLSAIPTSTDPQVDTVLILATADGGDETTLYLVTALPIGTSTYTDNTPDGLTAAVSSGPSLLTNSLYQYTDSYGILHGIANNAPPAKLFFPTKHKGRLYGSNGSTLFFSKNLDDVTTANGLTTAKWEEAWPAFYSLDISETAETIKGILSDGETLWIGTERAIRRLIGDSPQNFQKPEIQFNETGIFNQDVWKIVFYEGQPVGTMWLTPDLRVISSDFNTYRDVGRDIQDVLNTVNIGATVGPHASFVSKGQSDYYMLYLPTGGNLFPDTIAVYNLRTQKWFIWQPTDQVTASLFFIDASGAPRWLFAAQTGNIYEWIDGSNTDRIGVLSTPYTVTAVTSWLDFGDSNLRKALNQILYLGQAQPTITIEGAITDRDLDTLPQVVLPATATSIGPLQDLYVPLAGTPSNHRWYRLTFTASSAGAADILDGFSIESIGLFRY